jgi:signal transduction histidine kinase
VAASLAVELRANRENRFRLVNLCLSEEQFRRVDGWEDRLIHLPHVAESRDANSLIANEESLRAWLIALPCDMAWDVAAQLAEQGATVTDLDELRTMVDAEAASVLLQYFVRYLRTTRAVNTLIHSSERIFDLISAIKAYSNMDRAAILEVDVPEGLDATVRMLQSRMKHTTVVREYQAGLPCISAYGAELNQVWTALIENALDAMAGCPEGRLKLVCRIEADMLLVEIWDSGHGIPPEIQDRIFEPFFTTKPPGLGLGLSLDNAMRIVRKHRGHLSVKSEPGSTCFRVRLPLNQFQAY